MKARDIVDALYVGSLYSERARLAFEEGVSNVSYTELGQALSDALKQAYIRNDKKAAKKILKGIQTLRSWRQN